MQQCWLTICLVAAVGLMACMVPPAPEEIAAEPVHLTGGTTLQLALELVSDAFERPTFVTHAGDGSGRLFVTEQEGRLRVVQGGSLLETPVLDISGQVSCCGERGLLSVAFPPDYADKGYFYVNYTDNDGATVVSRFRMTDDPNVADPASEELILMLDQPFPNHNGGQLAFGPDAYLYIGTGDGGAAGDPGNRAQDPANLLGKMLRLDVEQADLFPYQPDQPYLVPPTNPYTQTAGFAPEIWAWGLRNPWRFSFDSATGDLYIADVGQNSFEELSYQPASSSGGENYGWRCKEGFADFNIDGECATRDLVPPIHAYPRGDGCSVTGGYVYRGSIYSSMQGVYIFGDYCTSTIWGLEPPPGSGEAWQRTTLLDNAVAGGLSSFGEDEAGNLYAAGLDSGTVYRLISLEQPADPTATPTSTALPTNTPPAASPTPTPEPDAVSLLWLPRVVRL